MTRKNNDAEEEMDADEGPSTADRGDRLSLRD
jgi:hypothetical protein